MSTEDSDPVPAPSLPPAPHLDRRTRLVVAAFVALAMGLGAWCAWVKSDTYDEPMYILSGYAYLTTGDFSINREHPPVAKLLLALPLLALDLELPSLYQQRPGIPFAFVFHQPRVDPHTILFLARLPGVLLAGVLALYAFRWARLAFGRRAGLLALALVATNPALVAHSAIAGNDFALAVFCFATLYHVWRWLTTDARGSLTLGAVTLGLAIGSKLTALMLLPVLGIVVLVEAVRRRRPALLGWSVVALLAAVGLLWLSYLGEARSLTDARQHVRYRQPDGSGRVFANAAVEHGLETVFGSDGPIPLLGLLRGVDMQLAHSDKGHVTYLRGEVSEQGFPDFYVQSWLFKAPIGLTLLLALGLVAARRTGRGLATEGLLYLFPLLAFLFFSRSRVQLGFTYILPIVPPLCVAASRVLAVGRDGRPPRASRAEAIAGLVVVAALSSACWLWFDDKGDSAWIPWVPLAVPAIYAGWVLRRLSRAGAGGVRLTGPVRLLGAWAVLGSLLQMPNALAHFNEWVGGPENGWHYSVVRDDWSQDVASLGRWMKREGVEHVYYDSFTTGDPEAWGVRSTPTFGRPPPSTDGWLAVHVNRLGRRGSAYRWLSDAQPVENLDGTILLYRIEDIRRGRQELGPGQEPQDAPRDDDPGDRSPLPFDVVPDDEGG